LEVSTGMVYISRDVTFDEEIFPFFKLNPNTGAQLCSDVALLHPTLFHHDCGDITIHYHITDNPLDTNNVVEVTREILRENGEHIEVVQEENQALELQLSQNERPSTSERASHFLTSPTTPVRGRHPEIEKSA
jgi:hypothetical protein